MANINTNKVRVPSAAGALSTGVTLTGGAAGPIATVHTRDCPVLAHKVELKNLQMLLTAGAGGAADAQGQKLLTLPVGKFALLAVKPNFTVTTPAGVSIATAVWSLGTVTGVDGDAALTTTEADILASQTLGDGTLAAGAAESETAPILGTGTAPALIGSTSAEVDIYFNIGGTTTHATVTDPKIAINGTIELILIDLGQ